jgi:membrane protease YdiL (CAAX protease family)
MKPIWPPAPLGFGTPLNLALGRAWKASLGLAVAAGVVIPPLILLLDRLLFAGVSMQRVRAFVAQPLADRIAVVATAGIAEELVFRVIASTLVAWIVYLATKRQTAAIWTGIVVAAILFGLAHVANLAHVPHPYLRAIVLNGIAGLALGWLYWRRGLEWAVLAHLIADTTLYLLLPAILLP